MLELKEVKIIFNKYKILYNLKVEKNDILALVGPTGVGKTTLLNVIAGFILPDSGSITLNKKDITKLEPDKRPVSYIFQEGNLFNHLTVAKNIALGLSPTLTLNVKQIDLLEQCLDRVSLLEHASKLPINLSGGQKQKVAIARALIRRQPILLMDEPFTGLDNASKYELISLVKEIKKQNNLTIIIITHNLDEVKLIANKIAFVNNGEIEFVGKAKDVLNSHHPEFNKYFAISQDS